MAHAVDDDGGGGGGGGVGSGHVGGAVTLTTVVDATAASCLIIIGNIAILQSSSFKISLQMMIATAMLGMAVALFVFLLHSTLSLVACFTIVAYQDCRFQSKLAC